MTLLDEPVTGVLSAGQIEALSRLHNPQHAELWVEQQAACLAQCAGCGL